MPIRACHTCSKPRTNYDVEQCKEKDCALKEPVIGTAEEYGFPTREQPRRRGRPPKQDASSE